MQPKSLCLALPLMLVAACTGGDESQPKPPQKTAFDSLTQTEQRARDVQGTVDAAAAKTREAADAESQGESAH